MKSIVAPKELPKWRLERNIWQEALLDSRKLSVFAKERGLKYSDFPNEVNELWLLGLLRADQVVSRQPVEIKGLDLVKETEDDYCIYSDAREYVESNEELSKLKRARKSCRYSPTS